MFIITTVDLWQFRLRHDCLIKAKCRQCTWEKRLKPGLFDQGVKTFWLDDCELDRFHTAFSCGPKEYCGLAAAGLLYPSIYGQGQENSSVAPLLLSRNLWVGAAKFGAALWSSDILSTWTELRAQVPTGKQIHSCTILQCKPKRSILKNQLVAVLVPVAAVNVLVLVLVLVVVVLLLMLVLGTVLVLPVELVGSITCAV